MKSPLLHSARLLLAGLILSVATSSVSSAAATAFSKIVAFGDSLTDHGNMVQFTGGAFPNAPTYVYGRQSNGPVWVEYLASRLGLTGKVQSYAVAGALTAPAPGYPTGNIYSVSENGSTPIPGLEGTDVRSQVNDYLLESNGTADPAALHILQGGPNDFPRVANPAIIVPNLLESFVALQLTGAKHIMIATLPDLGKTPRVILAEEHGSLPPGAGAFTSATINQINQALVTEVRATTLPGVTVTIVDMFQTLNNVSARPADYGIVNVHEPYLASGAGTNPATWLFWDDVHPTTRGHQITAEDSITALIDAYSPRNGEGNGNGVINSLRGLARVATPKR